jgi:ribosomal protein L35
LRSQNLNLDMFKRKTHKGTKKRITLTGSGKARFRKNNQNHFNIRRNSKRRLKHKSDNIIKNISKKLSALIA